MYKPTGNIVYGETKYHKGVDKGKRKYAEYKHEVTSKILLRNYESSLKNNFIITDVTHGDSKKRFYHIWQGIKARCTCTTDTTYKFYGGKGIKICDRWLDYTVFKYDMENGYKDNLTIDRIDPSGNYCKENCRWITQREQVKNQKREITYHFITINGVTKRIYEFLEDNNIKMNTYQYRLYRGWDEARACTEKIKPLTVNQKIQYGHIKK